MGDAAQVLRRLRSGAVNVQIVEYGPGFYLPEHAHQWACFQIVMRGQFKERGVGADSAFGAGALLYRPAGSPHENPLLASSSLSLCVQLDESVWRELLPALGEVAAPRVTQSAANLATANRIVAELGHADDLTPTVIDAACLQLLGALIRRWRAAGQQSDSGLMRRAQALIEKEGRAGSRLQVQTLADRLNVSRHALHRVFARATGISVSDYLRQRRLLEARRLLEETRTPISQVALVTGFADQSHLTRHFHATFGRTPRMVRQAAEPWPEAS